MTEHIDGFIHRFLNREYERMAASPPPDQQQSFMQIQLACPRKNPRSALFKPCGDYLAGYMGLLFRTNRGVMAPGADMAVVMPAVEFPCRFRKLFVARLPNFIPKMAVKRPQALEHFVSAGSELRFRRGNNAVKIFSEPGLLFFGKGREDADKTGHYRLLFVFAFLRQSHEHHAPIAIRRLAEDALSLFELCQCFIH
jgi:hypothetical protein